MGSPLWNYQSLVKSCLNLRSSQEDTVKRLCSLTKGLGVFFVPVNTIFHHGIQHS